jgi:hypothetical protein
MFCKLALASGRTIQSGLGAFKLCYSVATVGILMNVLRRENETSSVLVVTRLTSDFGDFLVILF